MVEVDASLSTGRYAGNDVVRPVHENDAKVMYAPDTRHPHSSRAASCGADAPSARGHVRDGLGGLLSRGAPVHPVHVDGFGIDERPVTVRDFRRFVTATGYVTLAERPLDADDYPEADRAPLVPGSLVFHRTRGRVDLRDYRNWWSYVAGRVLAASEGAGQRHLHARASPGGASLLRMPRRLLPGRASRYRPRRSGSAPRPAVLTAPCSRGAMSSLRLRLGVDV